MLRGGALFWVAVGVALTLPLGASASAQASQCARACIFVLGFAQLHDELPDVVGDCTEDMHFDPATGDALQSTTDGLLVWRKTDRLAAFTNGEQTWLAGPFGIQNRVDSERFAWEPDPTGLPIIPAPQPGERCPTAGIAVSLLGADPGAGNVVGTFGLTNMLGVPCTFYGYVGAELLESDDSPLPTVVLRGAGPFTNGPDASRIEVTPGGSAEFLVHWTQVPIGDERMCPMASSLAIILPDEYVPLRVPVAIRACGGGRLDVSPVQAPVVDVVTIGVPPRI
jgi:predicted Rdx family selenoprotein